MANSESHGPSQVPYEATVGRSHRPKPCCLDGCRCWQVKHSPCSCLDIVHVNVYSYVYHTCILHISYIYLIYIIHICIYLVGSIQLFPYAPWRVSRATRPRQPVAKISRTGTQGQEPGHVIGTVEPGFSYSSSLHCQNLPRWNDDWVTQIFEVRNDPNSTEIGAVFSLLTIPVSPISDPMTTRGPGSRWDPLTGAGGCFTFSFWGAAAIPEKLETRGVPREGGARTKSMVSTKAPVRFYLFVGNTETPRYASLECQACYMVLIDKKNPKKNLESQSRQVSCKLGRQFCISTISDETRFFWWYETMGSFIGLVFQKRLKPAKTHWISR